MTRVTHPPEDVLRRLALGRRGTAAQQAHVRECGACRGEMALVRALALAMQRSDAGPCPDAMDVVLLAEAKLEATRAREVRAHVSRCTSCAADVEGLARVRVPKTRSTKARAASAGARVAAAARALVDQVKALAAWDMPMHVALRARGASAAAPSDLAAGLEAYRDGKLDVATRRLKKAASATGAPAEASYFLGACLVNAGRLDEGIEHLEHAASRQPRLAEYRWRLAQALLLAGRDAEARAALEKVAKLPGTRKKAARAQIAALKGLAPKR